MDIAIGLVLLVIAIFSMWSGVRATLQTHECHHAQPRPFKKLGPGDPGPLPTVRMLK